MSQQIQSLTQRLTSRLICETC